MEEREARRMLEKLRQGNFTSFAFLSREWTLHYEDGKFLQTLFMAREKDKERVLAEDEAIGILTLYNYEKLLSRLAQGPPPGTAPSLELIE